MMRLAIIPLGLLALLAVAMGWLGRRIDEPPADFRFINSGDIRTLDPQSMSWNQDIRIGYAIYEGLYTLHPQTLKAIPGTAERIDISNDKTIYTFHIRRNAGWTDGRPVLARDFVFAWRRMLEHPGDYTYLLDYIKGAEAYRAAYARFLERPAELPRPDFASVGIEVLDERTLRVSLNHPVTFFPDLLAFPPYFPLHQEAMKPFEQVDPVTGHRTYDMRFMRPPHLQTNGPYRLAAWDFKRRVRLVANEHYWDRANVRSPIIDMIVVEDNKLGEFLRYEAGVVDWVADLAADIAAELLAQGRRDPSRRRQDLHIHPAFGTYFYTFNCLPRFKDGRPNPFSDPRVRRAFAMAIDRRPIIQNVTRLDEQPAYHYVPLRSFPDYPPPRGIPQDLEEARRLLAEAGYPGGKGFPRLKLTFNTGFNHGDVAQIIRRQWRDGLGVELELEGVESGEFSQRLHNVEYAVARASWYGDYDDVSTFTDKYLSTSDNNDSKWANTDYDRLCARAAREPDPAARLALLSQAEQILLEECPILPIYYYVNRSLQKPYVTGIAHSPRNLVMLKAVFAQR